MRKLTQIALITVLVGSMTLDTTMACRYFSRSWGCSSASYSCGSYYSGHGCSSYSSYGCSTGSYSCGSHASNCGCSACSSSCSTCGATDCSGCGGSACGSSPCCGEVVSDSPAVHDHSADVHHDRSSTRGAGQLAPEPPAMQPEIVNRPAQPTPAPVIDTAPTPPIIPKEDPFPVGSSPSEAAPVPPVAADQPAGEMRGESRPAEDVLFPDVATTPDDDLFGDDSADDLFGDQPTETTDDSDLFGSEPEQPNDTGDDLFGDPAGEEAPAEDDLFGGPSEEEELFDEAREEDDLFGDPTESPAEAATTDEDVFDDPAEEQEVFDATAEEDDLFGEPAGEGASEEDDLFGPDSNASDDDDLFGMPPGEETKDELPDSEDDLFGGPTVGQDGDDLFGEPDLGSGEDDLFGEPEQPASEQPADEEDDDLFGGFGAILRLPGGLASSETRQWVDNTGQFSCQGRVLRVTEGHVRLMKDNGRTATVPFYRLSRADLEFVHRQASALEAELIEKTAAL